jgi:hypothetical protein
MMMVIRKVWWFAGFVSCLRSVAEAQFSVVHALQTIQLCQTDVSLILLSMSLNKNNRLVKGRKMRARSKRVRVKVAFATVPE